MREQLNPLRILIVDDEPPARYLVRHLLSSEKDVNVVGEAENARQAVEFIQSLTVDLIFLDIELPGQGAFSVIQKVTPEKMPAVIFVTAHRQYAVDAFRLPAIDYLLKPIDADRFRASLTRARELLIKTDDVLSKLKTVHKDKSQTDLIAAEEGKKRTLIRMKEIAWLKADGSQVLAFAKGSQYRIRCSISEMEKLLPQEFVRIHRSMIVNVECVKEISRQSHGEYRLTLKDKTELHVSRNYRQRLLEKLES